MRDRNPESGSFLDELKRRRVVRVAIGYGAAVFVVLQAADIIFPALGVPEWGFRALVITSLVGFPIAVALAWAFQWTPDGLRRTDAAGRDGPVIARFRPASALVLGGAIVVTAISAVVWFRPSTASGSVAPDAEVIAVLPFSASGGGDNRLGEGMVDLISRNLDEVEGVRLVDPRMVLFRWNERAERGPITREVEIEIGRSVQAGSILTGSMVTLGSEVEILAELRALDGTELAAAEVRGPEDDLFGLVDRLSVELLRDIWRATTEMPALGVSDVTTENVDAMRYFLEGEKQYRASAWPLAVNAYTKAVEADPQFALAYYRLTRTLGWVGGDDTARRSGYIDLALAFSDRLPARVQELALAEKLWLEGEQDASIDTLRALAGRYPDDPETLHRLADSEYHRLHERAGPVAASIEEQVGEFERVLEIDPSFLPAIVHPLEVALRYGDTTRLARYASLIEASAGANPRATGLLEAAEAFLKDPDSQPLTRAFAVMLPQDGQTDGLSGQVISATGPVARRTAATLGPADQAAVTAMLRSEASGTNASQGLAARHLASILVATGHLGEARTVAAGSGSDEWVRRAVLDPVYAGYVGADYLDGAGPDALTPLQRATGRLAAALWSRDPAAAASALDEARAATPVDAADADPWSTLVAAGSGLTAALGSSAQGLDAAERALRAVGMSEGSFTEPLWFLWLDLAADMADRAETAIAGLERPWPGAPIFEVRRLGTLARALRTAGREDEAREMFDRFATALTTADRGLPIRAEADRARAAAHGMPADD